MDINNDKLKEAFFKEMQVKANDNPALYLQWLQVKQLDNVTDILAKINNQLALKKI